ncbi:PAS domain-containing protein [Fischerella sp. JS2]|uniref:PAS domain-containing protein n=1 Tax=Fischerella sp. JS2 TaxID=2597771 RepID=UPI0028ED31CD|nr:PAS domain-containing protein [Fischerella sp. JS2]
MLADSVSLPLTMVVALTTRTDLLMVLTDRTGRIEWVNQAFAKHISLTTEQLVGKKFFLYLDVIISCIFNKLISENNY